MALIEAGGPFPYSKDGTTFQNREGRLPKKSQGYYQEYTVITPGEGGSRRPPHHRRTGRASFITPPTTMTPSTGS